MTVQLLRRVAKLQCPPSHLRFRRDLRQWLEKLHGQPRLPILRGAMGKQPHHPRMPNRSQEPYFGHKPLSDFGIFRPQQLQRIPAPRRQVPGTPNLRRCANAQASRELILTNSIADLMGYRMIRPHVEVF